MDSIKQKALDGLKFELEYSRRNHMAHARVVCGMLAKGIEIIEEQEKEIKRLTLALDQVTSVNEGLLKVNHERDLLLMQYGWRWEGSGESLALVRHSPAVDENWRGE